MSLTLSGFIAEQAIKSLHTYMTGCTFGVRGKSILTVMTGTAILACIQGFHGKLLGMCFCITHLHFEQLIMAVSTCQSHVFSMHSVIKNNGLDRLVKNNGLGLFHVTAVAGNAGFRLGNTKGSIAVMTSTAVLSLFKGLHGVVPGSYSSTTFLLEDIRMTGVAVEPHVLNMYAMAEHILLRFLEYHLLHVAMTGNTGLSLGNPEGCIAVMTSAAVHSLFKRLHSVVSRGFGSTAFPLERVWVAGVAIKIKIYNMYAMAEHGAISTYNFCQRCTVASCYTNQAVVSSFFAICQAGCRVNQTNTSSCSKSKNNFIAHLHSFISPNH